MKRRAVTHQLDRALGSCRETLDNLRDESEAAPWVPNVVEDTKPEHVQVSRSYMNRSASARTDDSLALSGRPAARR
jgi:hypothetical protein